MPPDLSGRTAAVDTTTIATAVLAVGAISVGPTLVFRAVAYVSEMVSGIAAGRREMYEDNMEAFRREDEDYD